MKTMQNRLDRILKPRSIAIIGASNRPESVGYGVMKNMLNAGFGGIVYPVNLKETAVQGVLAYPSVEKIPEAVDLAVICTPAKTVPTIVKSCGEKGVGGLIVISAGFAEAGESGQVLFKEIKALAAQYKMRLVGPNCLGMINPRLGVNASFAPKMALPGNLALISQSGALLTSILDWSVDQQVGFSHFVSIGSMADVDFADLIDYFGTDPQTSCILIYMESMKNPRKFLSAARAFSRNKPIIVLKAGRSAEGSQAALSHTGTLAGNDAVFDAAFQRAGVIRVDTVAQLFNMAQAVAMQPLPRGNRLAVVTNAGGPGVLATDYLMENGGQLAKLSDATMAKLDTFLPPSWSKGNPVDVLGDADHTKYEQAIKVCAKDPGVDGVLVVLTPQSMTDPTTIAQAVVRASKETKKTVLASWMGEKDVTPGREILEDGSVANYRYPESAVDVFLRMTKYARDLELLFETPPAIPEDFKPDREAVQELIDQTYVAGRPSLMESEAKSLLQYYGIDVSRNRICATEQEALDFAAEIGYPVVMKIASPDILHKTDAGGVKLNIRTEDELKSTYQQILDNAKAYDEKARIEGILVEPMVKKGYELLLGAKKDPIFGPVVVFGRGGVEVELYKDTRMGLPPLNMALAAQIVKGTKIYSLLKGYRGMPGVDLKDIYFLLCKFAYLISDFPQISEVDINPYVVDAKGGVALDARIILDPGYADQESPSRNHLVISPYPKRYVRRETLSTGEEIMLRPIKPEDEPLLLDMLEKVSDESLYMRFFGFIPKITHNWMTRYTNIDYDREMAIIAEYNDGKKTHIIGVVRIIEDAWRESAEYSVLIADKWQGKGLGNMLTDYIMEIARERDLKKMVASVLASNEPMIHMFKKRGFDFERHDMESFEVSMEL